MKNGCSTILMPLRFFFDQVTRTGPQCRLPIFPFFSPLSILSQPKSLELQFATQNELSLPSSWSQSFIFSTSTFIGAAQKAAWPRFISAKLLAFGLRRFLPTVALRLPSTSPSFQKRPSKHLSHSVLIITYEKTHCKPCGSNWWCTAFDHFRENRLKPSKYDIILIYCKSRWPWVQTRLIQGNNEITFSIPFCHTVSRMVVLARSIPII